MVTVGIDCGAKNTKAVILGDGQILGKAQTLTGFDQSAAVEISLETALHEAGLELGRVRAIAGSGSGAKSIGIADLKINDIKAISLGARFFFPGASLVVDMGAEATRVARLGPDGRVEDFAVNDKCAAGAGAFIESMARALEIPLAEIGPLAMRSKSPITMNTQCVIFAESEVVGLIHAKTPPEDIAKAIHEAMASRIVSMIRRVGVDEKISVLGGLAHNMAILDALKRELGVREIMAPEIPEFGMALGSAIAAAEYEGGDDHRSN
jgi:benzoyl-CoA reductase subunit D